ncbi:hypothetical protein C8Q74DRAFT_1222358 [Fomes fomentarius]|nr:hypothetical protein C8Q74DRAFT_1222358 [Fomes fomentarius]
MTFTHRSSLPIELWRLIIGHLAHEDKKSCLLVSSQLHDVALSELFSHVTLYLGLWTTRGHKDNWNEGERAEMERLKKTTWEVLRHVSCTPAFATIIKQLSVRAYTQGDGLFELFCLAEALQKLDSLQSLRWYGSSPLPNSIVFDALAKRACPTLIDLRLPVLGAAVPSLAAFTGLHSLHLYDGSVFGDPNLENGEGYIYATIETNSKTLTRLSISGDVIWACPIRSLTNLHELELILPNELGGLALIFRHCVDLRSLTLHLDSIADEHPFFPLLQSNPTALPALTAFKLISHSDFDVTSAHGQILANFLENKTNLHMLDIDICTYHVSDEERVASYLNILPALPALNVLGLNLNDCYEDALLFDKLIPINVTAFLLRVEVQFFEDTLLRGSIDLLRKRKSLEYLHIIDYTGNTEFTILQLLEDHPEPLRLIGYGPYLRWIEHDPEEGTPRYSPSWSFERVAHQTVETFGCADWEWLFRHHDHHGIELKASRVAPIPHCCSAMYYPSS